MHNIISICFTTSWSNSNWIKNKASDYKIGLGLSWPHQNFAILRLFFIQIFLNWTACTCSFITHKHEQNLQIVNKTLRAFITNFLNKIKITMFPLLISKISNNIQCTSQMNSAFRECDCPAWRSLAKYYSPPSSRSKTNWPPVSNRVTLKQVKLLFGLLVIQLVWYIQYYT